MVPIKALGPRPLFTAVLWGPKQPLKKWECDQLQLKTETKKLIEIGIKKCYILTSSPSTNFALRKGFLSRGGGGL